MSTWFATACVASTPAMFLLSRRLIEGRHHHVRHHVTDWYYDRVPLMNSLARLHMYGAVNEYRCETTDQLPLGADDGTLVTVGDVEYVYCAGDDTWKQVVKPEPPDVSWIEFGRGKGWRRTIHGIR
jgi:hypothetical protein